MKIERINENQIRCTLTSADLQSREIRLSELAYGSVKAKQLFRDMMEQAQSEFGFVPDDAPLMIEAIPTSAESIILTITKVRDPEELDSRFSRFTLSDDSEPAEPKHTPFGADEILDMFKKLSEAHEVKKKSSSSHTDNEHSRSIAGFGLDEHSKTADTHSKASAGKGSANTAKPDRPSSAQIMQMYGFSELDDVIAAAKSVGHLFADKNVLYKTDADTNRYRLILHQTQSSPEEFNKFCNILSEYGVRIPCSPAMEAHLAELGHAMIRTEALQKLAAL